MRKTLKIFNQLFTHSLLSRTEFLDMASKGKVKEILSEISNFPTKYYGYNEIEKINKIVDVFIHNNKEKADEVIKFYQEIEKKGFDLNIFSYSSILKSYHIKKDHIEAERIMEEIKKKELTLLPTFYYYLLDIYKEKNMIDQLEYWVVEIIEKKIILDQKGVKLVIDYLIEKKKLPFFVKYLNNEPLTFTTTKYILESIANIDTKKWRVKIFELLIKHGSFSDDGLVEIYSIFIEHLCKNNHIMDVFEQYQNMTSKGLKVNTKITNTCLYNIAQNIGNTKILFQLYNNARENNVPMNSDTFYYLFSSHYFKDFYINELKMYLEHMKDNNVVPHEKLQHLIFYMLVSKDYIEVHKLRDYLLENFEFSVFYEIKLRYLDFVMPKEKILLKRIECKRKFRDSIKKINRDKFNQ